MPDLNLALTINAPLARVWQALTDNDDLTTWFAEHASCDAGQSRYDFWGKHTPGDPDRSGGQHRITRHEPERHLAFEWKLRGATTDVEFEVSAEDTKTMLVMRHRGLPELKPYQSSIGDFWTHVLEGLRFWLEGGAPYPLMDYHEPPQGDVRITVDIAADPHHVFLGLVQPTELNRWVATDAKVDPKPGGEYSYGWEHGPVKILEIEPDKKLSFAWSWPEEGETVTTWELDGSGGRTRVTVVQSGFAPKRNSEDYYIGWFKFVHRLKTMMEVGKSFERVRVLQDAELSGEV